MLEMHYMYDLDLKAIFTTRIIMGAPSLGNGRSVTTKILPKQQNLKAELPSLSVIIVIRMPLLRAGSLMSRTIISV